ncbi:hypothetical protein [Sphingomonas phyllosphaerae]|uniref:hypothetical protein n=1 Tax=Sphingomonas phyllosphaerae TaxID=257003 RepID=UPI0003B46E3E|nr:hypothetical protein [Sphingomonas phyllosphaerae]
MEILRSASLAFGEALRGADNETLTAQRAQVIEEQRAAVAAGMPAAFSERCRGETDKANLGFSQAVQSAPYASNTVDRAFGAFATIQPCGFDETQRPVVKNAGTVPLTFGGIVAASGADTLSGTSRRLEDYVVALTDIATGATADRTDAARAQLVAAGKGLLAATKIGGAAHAAVNVFDQAVSGIIAAKRNEATRTFLNRMDLVMPTLMERIGLAARYQHAAAAMGRARASQAIAHTANWTLNEPRLSQRASGQGMVATTERMMLFDQLTERLDAQNIAFIEVTAADPAGAARAFADAHHELTAVYNDPRSNRLALAEGLAEFTQAAVALDAAIGKTQK